MSSFKDFLEEFLGYLQFERGYSKNTISAYTVDLGQFFEFLSTNKTDIAFLT